MRADLNLIDLEGLQLHAPEMVHDLPPAAAVWCNTSTGTGRPSLPVR
jgi:hypothetical protein